MNKCQYCGSACNGLATHCLKCAAPLPVNIVKPMRQVATVSITAHQYPVTQTSLKDFAIYFSVAFGVVAILCATVYFVNLASPLSLVSEVSTAAPAAYTLEDSGFVADLKYTFARKEDKTVALFLPKMIPRNDEIMILATNKVINHAYGERVIGRPKPDGIRLSYFGETHNFMVMIIKEDTGEIHTLSIERVKRT
jgi:hypothetical protein